MSTREERARQIEQQIREILLHEWDPICVADVPEAQDEYNGYVGGVYLAGAASPAAVAAHLARIESDRMGLSSAPAARLGIATKLCALDVQLNAPDGAA